MFATDYQALTDGFVCGEATADGTPSYIKGVSDAATPATVLRNRNGCDAADGDMGLCFPVKKGDYWKVTKDTTNAGYIFWIPLEP